MICITLSASQHNLVHSGHNNVIIVSTMPGLTCSKCRTPQDHGTTN